MYIHIHQADLGEHTTGVRVCPLSTPSPPSFVCVYLTPVSLQTVGAYGGAGRKTAWAETGSEAGSEAGSESGIGAGWLQRLHLAGEDEWRQRVLDLQVALSLCGYIYIYIYIYVYVCKIGRAHV